MNAKHLTFAQFKRKFLQTKYCDRSSLPEGLNNGVYRKDEEFFNLECDHIPAKYLDDNFYGDDDGEWFDKDGTFFEYHCLYRISSYLSDKEISAIRSRIIKEFYKHHYKEFTDYWRERWYGIRPNPRLVKRTNFRYVYE